MTLLWMLWSKFKGYIIGAGAILASIGIIYAKGRSDGHDKAMGKVEDAIEDDVQDMEKIRRDLDGLSDDDLDDRLSDWTRKG